jgi:hypothetical protein
LYQLKRVILITVEVDHHDIEILRQQARKLAHFVRVGSELADGSAVSAGNSLGDDAAASDVWANECDRYGAI